MPKITSLVAQKNNSERINVYVDDQFFCGLSLDDAIRYDIVQGREVSDNELNNLLSASGENDLYVRALGYIVRNPRTEREIMRYLYKKDASPETATRIVNRLKTMNYLNDEAYAKMFTEQKSAKLGRGEIRNKLFNRGVNPKIIEQSIDEIEEESQEQLARRVAEKWLRNRDRSSQNLSKLYRYLGSKGFDFDLCSSTVELFKKHEPEIEKLDEYQNKYIEYRRAKEELKRRRRELKLLENEILDEGGG